MEHTKTIGHKLRIINKEIKKHMDEKSQRNQDDLTAMQHWVLDFLEAHEGHDVFQRDIEEAFSISRATASNMLSLMEKKGLIERISVERDARLKKILMTLRAKKMVAQAEQDIKEMEELLVRGMSEKEIAEFNHYLDRIRENLGIDSWGENTRCCGCGEKATHEKNKRIN